LPLEAQILAYQRYIIFNELKLGSGKLVNLNDSNEIMDYEHMLIYLNNTER